MIVRKYKISPAGRYDKIIMRHYARLNKPPEKPHVEQSGVYLDYTKTSAKIGLAIQF